jgi:heat shock protein HslJ
MKAFLYLILAMMVALTSCKSITKTSKPNEPASVGEANENLSFKAMKWKSGIDFYATGNEPSWAIDIDFDGIISFSALNGERIVFQKEEVKWYRTATPGFSASNSSGQLSFVSMLEDCSDSMSDEAFPYKITIDFIKEDDLIKTFTGCGNYVPDYRLDGKWKLDQLGAQKAVEEEFYGKIPYFTFEMDAFRFGGSSGCNMISGNVNISPGKLSFGQMISTMMACPEGKEDDLKQALNMTMFYTLDENRLILKNENQEITIVFERAE